VRDGGREKKEHFKASIDIAKYKTPDAWRYNNSKSNKKNDNVR
jgi:hypothetical protein